MVTVKLTTQYVSKKSYTFEYIFLIHYSSFSVICFQSYNIVINKIQFCMQTKLGFVPTKYQIHQRGYYKIEISCVNRQK